jgi:hypothetical protein
LRDGRSYHPAPAAPGILDHVPTQIFFLLFGFRFFHETTDRFGRILEGGVILINQHLGDNRGNRFLDPAAIEFVLQSLLQSITIAP